MHGPVRAAERFVQSAGHLGKQSHPFCLGKRKQLPARVWRLRRESHEGMREGHSWEREQHKPKLRGLKGPGMIREHHPWQVTAEGSRGPVV